MFRTSRFQSFALGWRLALAALAWPVAAWSQPSPPVADLGKWRLESVALASGVTYRGLVQLERAEELDFVEIVQPPGRAMYAVVRGVRKEEIVRLERLPPAEQRELAARFEQFRTRAAIEAGRLEQIQLTAHEEDGRKLLRYEGPWFRFEGLVDEETARRSIVRIEQAFRALRTLLPPQRSPAEPLRIRVLGSLDAYRAELRRHALDLDHPAFYSARERMIVAGGELDTFARELSVIRTEHARQEAVWKTRDAEFTRNTVKLREQLAAAGYSRDEVNSELRLRKSRWNDQLEAELALLAERNRGNLARFHELTARMFAQLSHEALHAYLDNYLFDPALRPPRWLHEGLALLFESGRLDGDTLRIDAPHPAMLAELQTELRRPESLGLEAFLVREDKPHQGAHAAGPAARRNYAYAWGLVWYLAFHRGLLASDRLQTYVEACDEMGPPAARFTQFTGQPLPAFEAAWRKALLETRPAK